MASNRDPRKKYRTNRQKLTEARTRARRQKQSTAPKPTSSSTRSTTKGTSKKVTSDSQRNSRRGTGAKVTRSQRPPAANRRVSTGIIGTTNQPGTKTKYTGPPGLGKNPPLRIASRGAKVASIVNPRTDLPTKIGAGIGLAADLYQSSRKPKSPKPKMKSAPGIDKGAVKKAKSDAKETNRQSKAASFDRAFAAARKAGKKTFTWKGKSYSTKLK